MITKFVLRNFRGDGKCNTHSLTHSPTHFFPQDNKEKAVSQREREREMNSDDDFQGVGEGMKYPSEIQCF